jgi:hypothetical protein
MEHREVGILGLCFWDGETSRMYRDRLSLFPRAIFYRDGGYSFQGESRGALGLELDLLGE